MVLAFLILAGLIYLLLGKYFILLWKRAVGQLPRGPLPLPFVGNALSINPSKPFATYEALTHKYGKMYTVMNGNELVLIIADLDLVKKAFKDERFSGRPKTIFSYFDMDKSIVFSEGAHWKEQRRFFLHTLRDFGFGKTQSEMYIEKAAAEIVEFFRTTEGRPTDVEHIFSEAGKTSSISSDDCWNRVLAEHMPDNLSGLASNTLAYLLFGKIFPREDDRFARYAKHAYDNGRMGSFAGTLALFPWLRHFSPFRGKMQAMADRFAEMTTLIMSIADEHRSNLDMDNPKDYVDSYLAEQRRGNPAFTDRQLWLNLDLIFNAGYETSSVTLQWAMMILIRNSDAQRRVQQEIDAVVGRDRPITNGDRAALPLLEAAVLELQRMANIAPFFVPHRTTEQLKFEGYTIPKDTTVFALSWALNRDRDVWTDPEVFRPERFLDKDGKIDSVMMGNGIFFSTGKRVCPGEVLARMELFVFIGCILQSFNLLPNDHGLPTLEPLNGLSLAPQPYEMRAIPRQT